MPTDAVIDSLLKRDRALVCGGIVTITALAWAYMVHLALGMQRMDMAMAQMRAWGLVDLLLMFVMWAVMMVAMMTPSAAPMVLLFATIRRKRTQETGPYGSTLAFLSGYLAVWAAYSVLATLAQWGLHSAALLSPMMVATSPILGGGILIGAGVFQWTPLKHACLRHCRSPLDFLMTGWQIRGVAHGAQPRRLLHGVLLDTHAPAVRGRCDESALDRAHHGLRVG